MACFMFISQSSFLPAEPGLRDSKILNQFIRTIPVHPSRSEGLHRRDGGLRFDLNLNTTGQVQLAQCIHGPGRRRVDIQQALVRCELELLTAFLVHVG